MRIYLLSMIALFLFGISCQENSKGRRIEGVQGGSISELIKHPIDAEGQRDTVNVAKLVFEEEVHDFGRVNEGEYVRHSFVFVNEGVVPLVISDARSTCGCTVPEWPKDLIQPGQKGQRARTIQYREQTGVSGKMGYDQSKYLPQQYQDPPAGICDTR